MRIKNTSFQTFIELICTALVITTTIYTFLSLNNMPENVPIHYDFSGEINRYGSKTEILLIPIINAILYILLTILSFFPNTWSIPIEITEKNKEFVYTNTKSLIIIMKLVIVLLFSYLTYAVINIIDISIFFTVLVLIGTFLPVIYYLYKIIVGSKKYK